MKVKNTRAFCEECRDEVDVLIDYKNLENTYKGKIYKYVGKVAYCKNCSSEVYISELEDYNLKSLYDVYRKENDIVSQEIILEIPKKYNIGKRPLSLLLGWGELTYTRYCDGDLPTKKYSDLLKNIYEDPIFYLNNLENNKSVLSDITYKKTKESVLDLLSEKTNENTKIYLVANYLIENCKDITHLSLQKALYYIQGFFYAFNGTFLFDEDCEAWVHGPVYRVIYDKYKNYIYDPLENEQTLEVDSFNSLEKVVLESVVKNICCYSGKILEEFTHSEIPWIETRGILERTDKTNAVIKKELISEYFLNVKIKYNMLTPNNIEDYTNHLFRSI